MIQRTASRVTKTNHQNKALTFGELIAGVYDVCGKRRARGILMLALSAHLVEFPGQQRFVISGR